jgi:hypothetical protein
MLTQRTGYTYSQAGGHMGSTFKEAIADGENGTPVAINSRYSTGPTCTILAGANSGKVQFTTSPDSEVAAGTAVWQDWPKGNVTGTDSDAIVGQVTAVRGVSVSGAVTIEVVA